MVAKHAKALTRMGFCRGVVTALLILGVATSGCTTVAFESSPEGAKLFVDGEFQGLTPQKVRLMTWVWTEHEVVFEKEGFKTKAILVEGEEFSVVYFLIAVWAFPLPIWAFVQPRKSYSVRLTPRVEVGVSGANTSQPDSVATGVVERFLGGTRDGETLMRTEEELFRATAALCGQITAGTLAATLPRSARGRPPSASGGCASSAGVSTTVRSTS